MFITTILDTCRRVKNSRSPHEVLGSVVEEVGELAKEINVAYGTSSYKSVGQDGVLGEIVDSISSLVDLAYLTKPDLTEAELFNLLLPKMAKWAQNSGYANKPSNFNTAKMPILYDTLAKAECIIDFGDFKLIEAVPSQIYYLCRHNGGLNWVICSCFDDQISFSDMIRSAERTVANWWCDTGLWSGLVVKYSELHAGTRFKFVSSGLQGNVYFRLNDRACGLDTSFVTKYYNSTRILSEIDPLVLVLD